MSSEESLIKLTTEAIKKLDLAMSELFKHLPKESHNIYHELKDRHDKYQIENLGMSIGLIRKFQKPIFERRPDLGPPPPKDYVPDPPLNDEQLVLANRLSETDIQKIDETLLSTACQNWRKVAFVVGKTMMDLSNRVTGIPDVFYSQRIQHLVEEGKLESQGNLAIMRYSEVRLPLKVVCSFCKLPSNKVKMIIAGPKVSICNSCVELCSVILNKNTKDYIKTEEKVEISIHSNITVGELRSLIAKYHFETVIKMKID